MTGPSSSHTAGACKIGQFARAIFHGTPSKISFYLHGSFAEVYQGHGTDRALLAGTMKLWTSDPRIKDAFAIAEKKKFKYSFTTVDLGPEYHPNSVRIVLENKNRKVSIIGSSVGGGEVAIVRINHVPVQINAQAGRFFSLMIGHDNKKNILNPLFKKLQQWQYPVAWKETTALKGNAITLLGIEDFSLRLPQVLELEKFPGIQFVRSLTKLMKV